MTDVELDRRNGEAVSRGHDAFLTPPAEGPECEECQGSGYQIGSETEMTWGTRCSRGCAHNPRKDPPMDTETIRMLRAS